MADDALLSRLNWDGSGIALRDEQGNISFSPHAAEIAALALPDVPEEAQHLGCIYLPMECFLTRTFAFPLQHRHHLDADMLGQELADVAGIDPEAWWLSWRSEKVSDGVAGVVFALPEATKKAMQTNPLWQQAPLLLIDGWERLNDWLEPVDKSDALAVIDADAEGVFFGFFAQGSWQGMRRLNSDMHDEQQSSLLAQQIVWSLQSMGMDLQETKTIGRLTSALANVLPLAHADHPPLIEKSLSPRHMFNFMLPNPKDRYQVSERDAYYQCNVRHGQWRLKQGIQLPNVWQRPVWMLLALGMVWFGLTLVQNIQMQQQISAAQEQMLEILHQALPGEPNIDLIKQLQRAAHVGESGVSAQSVALLTGQLRGISQTFAQHAWQMQTLKVNQEGVLLAGKISSLSALNAIRDMLADKLAADVNISDTDLSGDEVSFRMRW